MLQNLSKLLILVVIGSAALITGCDGSYGVSNQPLPVDADDAGDGQSVAVIADAINYGISDDGTGTKTNQVHLQLDGTFSPDSDNAVAVTCNGVALDPSKITVTAQSDSQILLMIPIPASSTSCGFAVMSTNLGEGDLDPIAISSTQKALKISSATNSHGKIVLSGTFASSGNTVAVACNGTVLDPSTVTVTSSSASKINVTIPDPTSSAPCIFAVLGNTVQTPNFTFTVNP